MHVWDGTNIVLDKTGTAITLYYRALTLIYAETGTEKTYYLYNGHGDVIALASSTGVITKTYVYDAFGEEKDPDDMDTNRFRYCGEYYDIESGTIYLRARYYNASTGRFTQEDPIKDGYNWYSYCAGNPVNLVDPSGTKRIDKHIALESGNPVKVIKPQKADTHIEFYDDGSGDIESEPRKKNDESKPAEKDTNIFTNTIENITDVIDELKEAHYARNDNQPIEDLPQTKDDAENIYKWVKQDDYKANCHNFTAEDHDNVKYMSPDGHREVIYDKDGNMVTASEDMGTYNYSSPIGIAGSIGHFFVDMLPWYIWGNSPDDTTTFTERFLGTFGIYLR